MFEPTSRYYNLRTTQFTTLEGRKITYVQRRFLPSGKTLPPLGEVFVREDERLDAITARALGDAEQFWQIADANDAMNPTALTAELGQRLRIPMPQV